MSSPTPSSSSSSSSSLLLPTTVTNSPSSPTPPPSSPPTTATTGDAPTTTPPPSTTSAGPTSSTTTTTTSSSTSVPIPPPSSSITPPTSSTTAPPSSSSSSSSTVTTPTTTNSTTSQVSSSTVITSVFFTTDAQGQSITTTLTTSSFTTVPTSAPSSSGGTTHVGAIVGGAVGGVVGVIIFAAFLVYCLRRQRRKDDFDGNFDPDRVGHGPVGALDLTAGEVEPYTYPSDRSQPDMHEGAHDPIGGAGLAGAGAGAYHQYQNAGTHSGSSDYPQSRSGMESHTSTSILSPAGITQSSAKESEAFSRSNGPGSSTHASGSSGLFVANPQGSPDRSGPTSPVVVHQDGGRVRVNEDEPEREIPPTYDSIPADEARR